MASRRALVVFSGGQDSTTCLYLAKEEHEFVSALTFAYAQRHAREIESAKKIASLANVEHEIVDLGPLFKGMSSLVDPSAPLPGASETTNHGAVQQLPSTFVPGRNMLFLSLAASRAYARDCNTLYIGVSQEDFAGYPDCREGFIKSMQQSIGAALDREITIQAPLMHLSKKQTVELAQRLPGCLDALAYSTTCYNGSHPPCNTCNACLLRARGFEQAGVIDPLLRSARQLC